MKSKLLVIELWGLGDLLIAGPFLRAACEKYDVTLLAKPFALELKPRFWPAVRIVPFVAPWTAFKNKYRLLTWPWKEIYQLRSLRKERFEIAVSGRRGDPRDHLLLWLTSAQERLGFPRIGSQLFLTRSMMKLPRLAHRYEQWRVLGNALHLNLPAREQGNDLLTVGRGVIVVHTGAAQSVRVWSLERYLGLVGRLRQKGYQVQVICDADQRAWWLERNESAVATPRSLTELAEWMLGAGLFVGNDSGPGHLAASSGVPTFTIFGPQLPELFAPLHPSAEWIEGAPCPYKPCFDSCRFPVAHCLADLTEEAVWKRMQQFLDRHPLPGTHK